MFGAFQDRCSSLRSVTVPAGVLLLDDGFDALTFARQWMTCTLIYSCVFFVKMSDIVTDGRSIPSITARITSSPRATVQISAPDRN